ncbi:arrestin domain-containing protein 3-like isoform X2 [Anneissia japonica]|uniref:arrestin domain-containing protein 3-like isoform X1 n=1 Tax=Anneissia japonica TaxID=1529436 RepID=UPI0014257E38|nr:arrestin domain-containing protein 3-like isoform X1 [Anneissia japonica]XP_033118109.1 arrestin domain-containing protein 3-like isoform X2 [Anneissia japonica]
MGKIRSFTIVLDNSHPVYRSGEYVKGRVVTNLKEPCHLELVQVVLIGKAKVWWQESGSVRTARHFGNEITYVNLRQVLWGGQFASQKLPGGDAVMRFTFQLPQSQLPTSFESKFGFIRYYIEATVDPGRHWLNKICRKVFTVIDDIDVNAPCYLSPSMTTKGLQIGCCWVCKSEFTASFEINRRAYCPGEFVRFSAEINNRSPDLMEIVVRLYQQTTLSDTGNQTNGTRTEHKLGPKTVWKHKLNSVLAFTTEHWDDIRVRMPMVPPTMSACPLIRVEYFIELVVKDECSSATLPLPVVIGTIPRSCYLSSLQTPSSSTTTTTTRPSLRGRRPVRTRGVSEATRLFDPGADSPPPYEAPPPSYEQCVFGLNVSDNEMDESIMNEDDATYIPMYTYSEHSNLYVELPDT